MRSIVLLFCFSLAACAGRGEPVEPVEPAVRSDASSAERGRALAAANCASCHAVAEADVSKVAEAPPFRDLQKKYPVENLQEALAEGISVGHPAMPQFQLTPEQVRDLIAYLKLLDPSAAPASNR